MDFIKSEEQGELILEMQKPFSTDDVFLFFIKINSIRLFYIFGFLIACYLYRTIDGYIIYFLTFFIMIIWYLIFFLKTYYIYKIEFETLTRVLSVYSNYPFLRINTKQEFQIKDVKIKKVQYQLSKIDTIVIISSDNQITKFPIFVYEYSLKKEDVNNFINKINKYL